MRTFKEIISFCSIHSIECDHSYQYYEDGGNKDELIVIIPPHRNNIIKVFEEFIGIKDANNAQINENCWLFKA